MRALALALACATGPAWAETPMTGAAFEAYVTGRTLSFTAPSGESFGVEMYLPGRRVIWSGAPGACTDGVWYESKGDICFRYQDDPEPKCWAVYHTGDGLRAVYTTRPGTTVIFEKITDADPLICDNLAS